MKLQDLPIKTSILFIRIIGNLPYKLLLLFGKGLGYLMLSLASNRRDIAEQNLRVCFPEHSEQQLKQLLKEHFISTGIGLMETAYCWSVDPNRLLAHSTLRGQQHLSSVLDSGKGAIILGFHLTSLEFGGLALANYVPMAAMYRQHRNKYFEKAMCTGRLKSVTDVIERDDVRTMLKNLKNGKAVWYAADQDYGAKHSIFVPFFNIQAATITATSRFVKMTGVPVIPLTHYRDKQSSKLIIQLHPALENFATTNEYTDAKMINEFLEQFLREHPADYLWLHRRFKTRPENSPSLYAEKSIYKVRTMMKSTFQSDLSKSDLLEGTQLKPELLKLPNGNYMRFLYRTSSLQRSPAIKFTRNSQQQKNKDIKIIKLFKYPQLAAEIIYYEKLIGKSLRGFYKA